MHYIRGGYMSKAKLTLYVDKGISKLAHRRAKLTGKSISTLVKEYFIQKENEIKNKDISPDVAKWIGILDTQKTYKELREEQIIFKMRRYENID